MWTWGGISFGYQQGGELWTHSGRHVGQFHGDEVYAPDGRYLGEVQGARLITHPGKRGKRQSPFTARPNRGSIGQFGNYVGYAMLSGFEDFPAPESF